MKTCTFNKQKRDVYESKTINFVIFFKFSSVNCLFHFFKTAYLEFLKKINSFKLKQFFTKFLL